MNDPAPAEVHLRARPFPEAIRRALGLDADADDMTVTVTASVFAQIANANERRDTAPRSMIFLWESDDICKVAMGDTNIVTIDHDTFDRSAMTEVIRALHTLCGIYGTAIVTVGQPGVRV